jgi:hypothetical protein
VTKPLAPAVWRAMTADDCALAMAAAQIRFPFGAGQGKNLVSKLALVAVSDTPQITDRQAEALRAIVRRYRRQLPPFIVAIAGVGQDGEI